MLKIQTFKGGYDDNFSYILYDDETKDACIIDLALEPELLLDFIKENNFKLNFVVIMHSHFDHLVGFDFYKKERIVIMGFDNIKIDVDKKLKDDEIISLGNHKIKVIHTPGHIYDCICLLVESWLFTTDCLFIDGCGRCDLAGADVKEQFKSLEKIKKLPDNTIIYPGHDYGDKPFDTLKNQKETNRFLICEREEEFAEYRL